MEENMEKTNGQNCIHIFFEAIQKYDPQLFCPVYILDLLDGDGAKSPPPPVNPPRKGVDSAVVRQEFQTVAVPCSCCRGWHIAYWYSYKLVDYLVHECDICDIAW